MNTSNITLSEATPEDAEMVFKAIHAHRDDLRVWLPFVDQLKTVEDERMFLTSICEMPEKTRNTVYIIKVEDNFAGLVGYVNSDFVNHRTEIGYWLLPEFRGKGVMTYCVKYVCRIAVNERGMHRIQIRCATENIPSNHIPLRLGFELEGTERDGELLTGNRYTDINIYSILEEDVRNWSE